MTAWQYFTRSGMRELLPPLTGTDVVETVGAMEAELMIRARQSRHGVICLRHDRGSNRQRLAARRLVRRELLAASHYLPGRRIRKDEKWIAGGLYYYALTPRGAECWLRYPKPKKEQR